MGKTSWKHFFKTFIVVALLTFQAVHAFEFGMADLDLAPTSTQIQPTHKPTSGMQTDTSHERGIVDVADYLADLRQPRRQPVSRPTEQRRLLVPLRKPLVSSRPRSPRLAKPKVLLPLAERLEQYEGAEEYVRALERKAEEYAQPIRAKYDPKKGMPTSAQIRAVLAGREVQEISKKVTWLSEKGRKLLNIAGKLVHPLQAAQDLYTSFMKKYVYGAINKQIDEAQRTVLEESGMQKLPVWQTMAPVYQTMRTHHIPQLKARIQGVLNGKIKNALERVHTRLVLPALAVTYGLPLNELTYHGYQMLENQKRDLKVSDAAELATFIAAYRPVLDHLNVDSDELTIENFNNVLIPVFEGIAMPFDDRKAGRTRTLKSTEIRKKLEKLTQELPQLSTPAKQQLRITQLKEDLIQTRNTLLRSTRGDRQIELTPDWVLQRKAGALTSLEGVADKLIEKRMTNAQKKVTNGFSSAYANALSTIGIKKKQRKTMTSQHFGQLMPLFKKILVGNAKDPEMPKLLQQIGELNLPWSTDKGYKDTHMQALMQSHKKKKPTEIIKLQRQLAWAEQRLMDTFAEDTQKFYKEKYHTDYKEVEPVSYAMYLKRRLMPKMLLLHFGGKKFPGTNIVVNEKTLDEVIEKIESIQAKAEKYYGMAKEVYDKFQKALQIYNLTLKVSDAIAMTLELTQHKDVDNYYSKLFANIDSYVDAFDALMGILDIPARDLGITKMLTESKRYQQLYENAPEFIQFEMPEKEVVNKEEQKERDEEETERTPLHKSLGTLRYFAQQYHRLNENFGKLFIAQVDESGEKIFSLQPNYVLKVGSKIAIGQLKPQLKSILLRMLQKVLVARFGTYMGPSIANTLINLFDRDFDKLKETWNLMKEGFDAEEGRAQDRRIAEYQMQREALERQPSARLPQREQQQQRRVLAY